ncbi:hypothetical protein OPV22_019074 [Ensete ventricosum]|uniref:Uncharacterized protein n=1 Tax=Ensete ventricosum TaxID=4639 RepID=A0AAV8R1P0_ENSVE|nr:hypothetical protein OPV22_019074 [Ensete ventricosum]
METAASVQGGKGREGRCLILIAWLKGGSPPPSISAAFGLELPEKAARPFSRSFASSAVHISTRLDIFSFGALDQVRHCLITLHPTAKDCTAVGHLHRLMGKEKEIE